MHYIFYDLPTSLKCVHGLFGIWSVCCTLMYFLSCLVVLGIWYKALLVEYHPR